MRNILKNSKIHALFVVILITLNGCSVMNDSYDCPLKNTASCVSLADMDNRITLLDKQNKFKRAPDLASNKQIIWFAPYKDSAGNAHGASFMEVL